MTDEERAQRNTVNAVVYLNKAIFYLPKGADRRRLQEARNSMVETVRALDKGLKDFNPSKGWMEDQ